jgi:hypothetical protein
MVQCYSPFSIPWLSIASVFPLDGTMCLGSVFFYCFKQIIHQPAKAWILTKHILKNIKYLPLLRSFLGFYDVTSILSLFYKDFHY